MFSYMCQDIADVSLIEWFIPFCSMKLSEETIIFVYLKYSRHKMPCVLLPDCEAVIGKQLRDVISMREHHSIPAGPYHHAFGPRAFVAGE